jgi:hypothetical protein
VLKGERVETLPPAREVKEMNEERKPLIDEDLGLTLVDVVLKGLPRQTKNGLIFTVVDKSGKEWRLGALDAEAVKSLKEHGYKDSNNRVHLLVPQTALREPIGWLRGSF